MLINIELELSMTMVIVWRFSTEEKCSPKKFESVATVVKASTDKKYNYNPKKNKRFLRAVK